MATSCWRAWGGDERNQFHQHFLKNEGLLVLRGRRDGLGQKIQQGTIQAFQFVVEHFQITLLALADHRIRGQVPGKVGFQKVQIDGQGVERGFKVVAQRAVKAGQRAVAPHQAQILVAVMRSRLARKEDPEPLIHKIDGKKFQRCFFAITSAGEFNFKSGAAGLSLSRGPEGGGDGFFE